MEVYNLSRVQFQVANALVAGGSEAVLGLHIGNNFKGTDFFLTDIWSVHYAATRAPTGWRGRAKTLGTHCTAGSARVVSSMAEDFETQTCVK